MNTNERPLISSVIRQVKCSPKSGVPKLFYAPHPLEMFYQCVHPYKSYITFEDVFLKLLLFEPRIEPHTMPYSGIHCSHTRIE